MITQGEQDAINAINLGQKTSVENLVHYHQLKKSNDERIQNMNYGDFIEAKASQDYGFENVVMESYPSVVE